MSNPRPRHPRVGGPPATRRDRHGRGLRTPLLPADLPASRSRAQEFDQVVMEAVTELQERWSAELSQVDFAVDDVPPLPPGSVAPGPNVVLDNGVPLARFMPAGIDPRGRQTKARVVVYRRPIEMRAGEIGEVADLVEEVLSEQVAAIIGESESDE
ncbi:metallopeptidase family protein [Nakamurella silvestris]|nr:metallopeptidase family protein [Nakamurella silvestris]